MNLPVLLIFYVSQWKNNKKHWKIGIWRHCDVIMGRGKSKLDVGLLCTEMIIVCNFMTLALLVPEVQRGGPRSPPPPPPVTDRPKKPSLNRVKQLERRSLKKVAFNGIRTHDLRDTGAMLYQLSYEATHWEQGQFIEFISSRAVKSCEIYMK